MCGRYVSALPSAELARIFDALCELPNVEPNWNVAPTNRMPVIRRHPEKELLQPLPAGSLHAETVRPDGG